VSRSDSGKAGLLLGGILHGGKHHSGNKSSASGLTTGIDTMTLNGLGRLASVPVLACLSRGVALELHFGRPFVRVVLDGGRC
jgi:hypothetical protein